MSPSKTVADAQMAKTRLKRKGTRDHNSVESTRVVEVDDAALAKGVYLCLWWWVVRRATGK